MKKRIPETSHYVYKFVNDDEWLYVGKSDVKSFSRILSHGKPGDNIDEDAWEEINGADIFYATFYNATMNDVIESALINQYKPKYNKAKTNTEWNGLEPPTINWIPFRVKSQDEIISLQKKIDGLKIYSSNLQRENNKLKKNLLKHKNEKHVNLVLNSVTTNELLWKNIIDNSYPRLTREEIGFIHKYYKINGLKFTSVTIYDNFEKNVMEVSYINEKIKGHIRYASGTEVVATLDDDGKPDSSPFNFVLFHYFTPSTIAVYKLLKALYSDLLIELDGFYQKTKLTISAFIEEARNRKCVSPWMHFMDYDCSFKYFPPDCFEKTMPEHVFIHDPDNIPFSLQYIGENFDADVMDFVNKTCNLMCIQDEPMFRYTEIKRRLNELEQFEKSIINSSAWKNYNSLYSAIGYHPSFDLIDRYLVSEDTYDKDETGLIYRYKNKFGKGYANNI